MIKIDIQNKNIINNLIITNRNKATIQIIIMEINNQIYHQETPIILIWNTIKAEEDHQVGRKLNKQETLYNY